MTQADLIVDYLEQFGVEFVFGVPGSPLGPLFDALARSGRRGGPRSVLARHESGAAFIAEGYARTSGKIGVCCSTTGPGATNLVTGVWSAYAEQVPLLVITTQTRIADFDRGCFQDSTRNGIDIMGLFDSCTLYNSMVTHPDQLERKLVAALTAALDTPKGPAHLSIPVNILATETGGPASYPGLHALLNVGNGTIDSAALERLCEEVTEVLRRRKKIVLLLGHNCRDAGKEITRFAELTGAAMVTTPRGKPVINPYHPLARGGFGYAGHSSARMALADEEVELILAAGTNLGEWSTSKWDPLLMNGKLIHIHDNPAWFARSPMARLHMQGNIGVVFSRLNECLERSQHSEKPILAPMKGGDPEAPTSSGYVPANITVQDPACCQPSGDGRPIGAPRLFALLVSRLPRESRFFIDNSTSVPWSLHYFFHSRPEAYHLSLEFATMAWAIGAAIGSAFADRSSPAVCITGDGCYLMSGQEITVAVEQKLPVLFVVFNDHAYGLIRHGHRITGKEGVNFDIPAVDFAMMAKAAGARAHTIREEKDLDLIDWRELALHQGPTLLEVTVDREKQPPLAMA